MDFALDDAQRAITALAADVLARSGSAHHDHAEFSSNGAEHSSRSWTGSWCDLAKVGLESLVLPEWLGGDWLGVLEAAVLPTGVGRRELIASAGLGLPRAPR